MTKKIKFAGNLEAALIEHDQFYKGYDVKGSMNYKIGVIPCYMPSRTRNNNMETVREIETREAR